MRRILFCLAVASAVFSLRAQTVPGTSVPNISTNPPGRTIARLQKFEFKEGDRVVFLGDTWMEREQKEGYIETLLTSPVQGKKVIFRNLAWSADTVLGRSRASFDPPEKGFERLREQLEAIRPTVVFLGYGMAESFNGDAGLEKFKRDMNMLMDTISNLSKPEPVRFVIVTPLYHERLAPPLPDPTEHNAQLELYANALRAVATARDARLIDLFTMTRDYHRRPSAPNLTDNGIHPTPYGYWRIASFFERALNIFAGFPRMGITANNSIRGGTAGVKPGDITRTENTIRFTGDDEFVFPAPEPKRLGDTNAPSGFLVQFLPLPAGKYTLKVDGEASAVYSDAEWGRGAIVQNGPLYGRVEELRHAIVKKNELFFYRWRPQNQTYLFGFRKYEQGRNAKEIPMFDPLISAEEEKIFRLAELKKRQYELAPAEPGDEEKLTKTNEKPAPSEEIHSTPLPEPAFELAPNLEVTLWAENPLLAKPIQINFDPQGRLWVASSSVYPQIQPGQKANDKILILEDTNGDGKADKTTVFADGLLIPTGVMPGDGGAYVANSTELLFYKDYDDDGHADEKRIMLSGFGTEDTHHILHTLRWGFDGQLYMNQSIYIHSHIETPHGVVRLNSGGTLNLRPATQELGVHMKGLVNSWGHHFDRFGQSFVTDGAGGEGINWVIPQAMFVTYEGARRVLHSVSPGSYPKFASLEIVDSEAFPEDWQGTMVTCDFRAHRVVRFAINDQGAGYVTTELPDVMRSTNVTFRPIDVKLGPDGAIYIADWSNPIIQHGEVDFRDPRRDHEHGRIWRIKYKDRPLLKKANLVAAGNSELFNNLLSPNVYAREQSRRVLTERGTKIKEDLDHWVENQKSEQAQLEALWMYQAIDMPNADLLKKVLEAKDGRIRAAAVRVLSFWWNRIVDPIGLLAEHVTDEHPRVRVEAVRAAAKIPVARSAELVLRALEKPMDRFLDYAIWLSINDLAEPWVKAIQSGEWKWEGREKELEFGLKAIEPAQAGAVLTKVLAEKPIDHEGSGPWIDLVSAAGSREQLSALLDQAVSGYFNETAQVNVLKALSEAARLRQASPNKDQEKIASLFNSMNAEVRAAAVRLVGQWKLSRFMNDLLKIAETKETPQPVRNAAFLSLREMGGSAAEGVARLAGKETSDP
ncbi:MAG TPA: PVC-type heme-binding CxxCH protein, partial [Verrucomicrobiae bacterium]|nr:PVC-type heme-binding CxxCH protein [Verrucomicrobiae bacterium]